MALRGRECNGRLKAQKSIPTSQQLFSSHCLVGHGVIRIVCHIRSRFVGGRSSRRALPATDIYRGEVLGHLSHLITKAVACCISGFSYMLGIALDPRYPHKSGK